MNADTSYARRPGAVAAGLPAITLWPAAAAVALLEFSTPGAELDPGLGRSAADARQDTVASSAAGSPVDPIYERELFVYTARRRDPFLPPKHPGTADPFSDDVRLLGVIHHDWPELSVALLGNVRASGDEGDPGTADERPRTAVRLRQGQRIGAVRLAKIHSDHVVLEVDTPTGAVRRMVRISPANGRIRS